MVQHHLLATHPVGKPILSGGVTGPEGSIFVLPILALISFIIIFIDGREQLDAVVQRDILEPQQPFMFPKIANWGIAALIERLNKLK